MSSIEHTPVPPRFLLTRLDLEWRRLSCRADAVRRAKGWLTELPVDTRRMRSLDDLLRMSGLGRREYADAEARAAAEEHADAVLYAVVVAAVHDELAARVVLQRLLPGLSAIARRRRSAEQSHFDLLDELLGAAWTVIRCYPLDRRGPRHVAAQLLRDAEYRAFVRGNRRRMRQEPTDAAVLERALGADLPMPDPRTELADLVRDARRRDLSDDDVRLVAVLLSSDSMQQAARALSVSERTLRNHRAAVVHRLRRAAA